MPGSSINILNDSEDELPRVLQDTGIVRVPRTMDTKVNSQDEDILLTGT